MRPVADAQCVNWRRSGYRQCYVSKWRIGLGHKKVINLYSQMLAGIAFLRFAAIVAMFCAIIGIRVAEAERYGSAETKCDGKNGYGSYRRFRNFPECTQYAHCRQVYHNGKCGVKFQTSDVNRQFNSPCPEVFGIHLVRLLRRHVQAALCSVPSGVCAAMRG